jgi:hypothetical protein
MMRKQCGLFGVKLDGTYSKCWALYGIEENLSNNKNSLL